MVPRFFTVAVSFIRGEGENVQRKPKLTCYRSETALVGDDMLQGPSQALRTRGKARIILRNNCHPLFLVSNIISKSNRLVARGNVLKEMKACTGRESNLVEKKNPSLSKSHLGNGSKLIDG